MLERVLVCLLSGGHLLIEGVPGLAKTLTVKTTAAVLGGTFHRVQFTPDLVPADLVGTRIYRPDRAEFEIELGPVLCNFLLADEINRAPAKVQSALLEVMQERQVTIGGRTFPVPSPFLVLATQNPIESEGTYPLPEAQVDRFMLKVLVDYPAHDEELTVVARSLEAPPELTQILSLDELIVLQQRATEVYVDPALISWTVQVATATRRPREYGLEGIADFISYGASPRGPISLVAAGRALALLRGRDYVVSADLEALVRGRVPAPPRAQLSRAGRGGRSGHDPRPGADGRARTPTRPRAPARGGVTRNRVTTTEPLAPTRTPAQPGPGALSTCLAPRARAGGRAAGGRAARRRLPLGVRRASAASCGRCARISRATMSGASNGTRPREPASRTCGSSSPSACSSRGS